MSLKLDEFLPEDEYIETKEGKKYYVTARIPRDLFMRIMGISEDFQKGINKESIENINNVIVDILSLKNDAEESRKFLESIDIQNWNKIVMFIMKYITNSVTAENDKKKTD